MIIAGLGNPTKKYQNTFHNIGFAVIEYLQEKLQPIQKKTKFQSIIFQDKYNQKNYYLLLPQTYMNRSGDAIAAFLNFYKAKPSELLVVCDSLDLDIATIRYKKSGGHGGHNGLKDIIQKTSSTEFARICIGIGRPQRKEEVTSYVLQKIPVNLKQTFQNAVQQAGDLCLDFLVGKENFTTIKATKV